MSLQDIPSISVTGNLSSGVTTFCKRLEEVVNPPINFMIIGEPIELIEKFVSKNDRDNILSDYFDDADSQIAIKFQLWTLECIDNVYQHIAQDLEKNPVDLLVFDRGLDSIWLFIDMMKSKGYLSNIDYINILEKIKKIHEKYFGEQTFSSDRVCFIDTPVIDCVQRIKIINPEINEQSFLNDLESLDHFYNDYLWFFKSVKPSDVILRLDLSLDNPDPYI